ncbi:hypothetical protein [Deinococcus peraridilitoris]|nr:hypothetical protein [Deinococcus peraridilitoris]
MAAEAESAELAQEQDSTWEVPARAGLAARVQEQAGVEALPGEQ